MVRADHEMGLQGLEEGGQVETRNIDSEAWLHLCLKHPSTHGPAGPTPGVRSQRTELLSTRERKLVTRPAAPTCASVLTRSLLVND